tara:strand:- start:371 stop:559 length:189 start_codon:yes stop_codon:yes gene_type:complete
MSKPRHLQKSVRLTQTVAGIRPVLKEYDFLKFHADCKKIKQKPTAVLTKLVEAWVDGKINLS